MSARNFGTIPCSLWGSPELAHVRGNADALMVISYLLTCRHGNALGLYYLPPLFAGHEMGITPERFTAALEALGSSVVAVDGEYVYVRPALRWQIGALGPRDKRTAHAVAVARACPSLALHALAATDYPGIIPAPDAPSMPHRCPIDAPRKPLGSPSEGASMPPFLLLSSGDEVGEQEGEGKGTGEGEGVDGGFAELWEAYQESRRMGLELRGERFAARKATATQRRLIALRARSHGRADVLAALQGLRYSLWHLGMVTAWRNVRVSAITAETERRQVIELDKGGHRMDLERAMSVTREVDQVAKLADLWANPPEWAAEVYGDAPDAEATAAAIESRRWSTICKRLAADPSVSPADLAELLALEVRGDGPSGVVLSAPNDWRVPYRVDVAIARAVMRGDGPGFEVRFYGEPPERIDSPRLSRLVTALRGTVDSREEFARTYGALRAVGDDARGLVAICPAEALSYVRSNAEAVGKSASALGITCPLAVYAEDPADGFLEINHGAR